VGNNTLLVTTLRTTKIRSNLHTGQYANHSKGQALVEPLFIIP